MPANRGHFRTFYGAYPMHLLILLASFALAGYAVFQIRSDPKLLTMALWFAAAVIGHDLILFPLYTAADHTLHHVLGDDTRRSRRVPLVNHVRIPALASGLLLLLFLPGIIRQGQKTYLAATGQTQEPFLVRWLLLTALFFATSAIAYGIRTARARHR
ncbi:hypothetical protein [Actinophytocola oryzae]|uniref:Uncharacterized protein n=1 Tax=Actinophytocola oryzae TaxID=502181 RepID=A0A4R7V873_9PSEU|nr:hypothetical protein [Actinophytocola oryzae]TDV44216.1 hypothetical protein CLV71_114125 [Actinophytocola oryzae]